MCGIAGIITPEPEARITAALKALEHRGRDDEGMLVSEAFGPDKLKTGLGHRRLSIIDTSPAGHQPMLTEDGRFAIILNGEIYNYKEVRQTLEDAGEIFATGSDTEVLLKAFRKWNVGCLDKLNGMFAFAVWDDVEKELTLVRDRAGIKPLYYAQTGGGFAFASEIKAILATGFVPAELDPQGFDQFLTFLWPVPPHTLFKDIVQLLPGHFLTWKNREVKIREWWDIDFSAEERDSNEPIWIERVLETLDRVTDLEMVADVPVGAFLSGGVDSSLIVALMTKHARGKVATYTTGMSSDDLSYDIIPDDTEWSRKVAAMFPVEHHEAVLTPDLADLLPKLVWHQDAPVIDMAIPTYLISREARATETVMLSGMGGDEVFGGYPRQMAMKIAAVTDILPSAVRRPAMRAIDRVLYGGLRGQLTAPLRNAKKFARSAALEFEDRYLGFGTYLTGEMKERLLAPEIRERTRDFDPYCYHRKYFRRCRDVSPINRLLYVDFKTFLPALNLDTTDRASMAANLEVRVPFLNKELLELAVRIPSSLKIKGLKRKYVLKKAAERLLSRDVVWRRKAGFGAPIRSWLRGPLKPMVDDLLCESAVRKRALFEPRAVRDLIDRNLAGREDLNLQVFQLLTFELWMQQFLDGR